MADPAAPAPSVRPMERGDLPGVGAVLDATDLFPSAMLADMAAPFLDGTAPHLWLVAEESDRIVGFAYCEPERLTEGTHNLLAIAVAPDRQGRGIGRAIVRAVESRLSGIGARILLVETSSHDEYAPTRAFYAGQGYGEEGRIRDFYSDGDDKVIFRKPLRRLAA